MPGGGGERPAPREGRCGFLGGEGERARGGGVGGHGKAPPEPLFVGKIAREHIRFIRELQLRGVIRPASVLPRYLQFPGVSEKLQALSQGMSVFDLIEG
jgi:hypothetical protein